MRWSILKYLTFIAKRNAYRSNLADIEVNVGERILDIGAGDCVVRDLYCDPRVEYYGLEPSGFSVREKSRLPGKNLITDFYPSQKISDIKFDKIFALTVLDEVDDKEYFVRHLSKNLVDNGNIIVAVRNSDFPLKLSREVFQKHSGAYVKEYGFRNWVHIFKEFEIITIKKFQRPLFSEKITVTLKLLLLRLIDPYLPIDKTYMLLFILRKK